MGIVFKFGRMSSLEDGEHMLQTIDSIGFMTTLSPPSYYMTVSLPPFVRASISLTTRRFFLVVYCGGTVFQELSSWYPGRAPEGNAEYVASVRTGNMVWAGPYLEVVSRNEGRPWYCRLCYAPYIRMRFYMKDPDSPCEIMMEQMDNQGDLQHS